MVPSGDAAELARCLERLAADPALVARLGDGARRRAESFSVERRGRQYVELLRGVTGHA